MNSGRGAFSKPYMAKLVLHASLYANYRGNANFNRTASIMRHRRDYCKMVVEPPITSSALGAITMALEASPDKRAASRSNAIRPISSQGCRTVVSAGCIFANSPTPSNPASFTSRGIASPILSSVSATFTAAKRLDTGAVRKALRHRLQAPYLVAVNRRPTVGRDACPHASAANHILPLHPGRRIRTESQNHRTQSNRHSGNRHHHSPHNHPPKTLCASAPLREIIPHFNHNHRHSHPNKHNKQPPRQDKVHRPVSTLPLKVKQYMPVEDGRRERRDREPRERDQRAPHRPPDTKRQRDEC